MKREMGGYIEQKKTHENVDFLPEDRTHTHRDADLLVEIPT